MHTKEAFLHKRHKQDKRFKLFAKLAVSLSLLMLVTLISGLGYFGFQGLFRVHVSTNFTYEETTPLIHQIRTTFSKDERKLLSGSLDLYLLKFPHLRSLKDKESVNIWLPLYDAADQYLKDSKKVSAYKKDILANWQEAGRLDMKLNTTFFTATDSREPELAGIWSALVGTGLTILITLVFAFPISIFTALYLEEFAKRNRITNFVEVNINNLAAVPSIIYGLLGLAVFINQLHMPRSSALVGGLTLGLITIPILIISTRSALQSVPKSIRQAARGLGASQVQITFHHVLPLATPGIITGAILGFSRALGESAPLIMIGMVAFIVDVPTTFLEPATTLPVQIFSWVRNPEQGFLDLAALGILVLVLILSIINGVAIVVRKKFKVKF